MMREQGHMGIEVADTKRSVGSIVRCWEAKMHTKLPRRPEIVDDWSIPSLNA